MQFRWKEAYFLSVEIKLFNWSSLNVHLILSPRWSSYWLCLDFLNLLITHQNGYLEIETKRRMRKEVVENGYTGHFNLSADSKGGNAFKYRFLITQRKTE